MNKLWLILLLQVALITNAFCDECCYARIYLDKDSLNKEVVCRVQSYTFETSDLSKRTLININEEEIIYHSVRLHKLGCDTCDVIIDLHDTIVYQSADYLKLPYSFFGENDYDVTFYLTTSFCTDKRICAGRGLYLAQPKQTTSINPLNKEAFSISIYPNPATNCLHINVSPTELQSIKIFDVSGYLLMEFFADNLLNVSALSSGFYIIRIVQNDRVFSSTFIIQR